MNNQDDLKDGQKVVLPQSVEDSYQKAMKAISELKKIFKPNKI